MIPAINQPSDRLDFSPREQSKAAVTRSFQRAAAAVKAATSFQNRPHVDNPIIFKGPDVHGQNHTPESRPQILQGEPIWVDHTKPDSRFALDQIAAFTAQKPWGPGLVKCLSDLIEITKSIDDHDVLSEIDFFVSCHIERLLPPPGPGQIHTMTDEERIARGLPPRTP